MNRSGSVFLKGIIVILLVVAGGGGYLYVVNSPWIEPILPQKIREQREYLRFRKLFPDKIGEYELYARGPDKIRVESECETIEEQPDTKASGIKGKVCGRTVRGEYRETNSDRVVFMHLVQFTDGQETYRQLLTRMTQADKLDGKDIVRIERHELGWFPVADFDMVLTQEGRWKSDKKGGENMSYLEKATGKDPVTQYFLGKFPPAIK